MQGYASPVFRMALCGTTGPCLYIYLVMFKALILNLTIYLFCVNKWSNFSNIFSV